MKKILFSALFVVVWTVVMLSMDKLGVRDNAAYAFAGAVLATLNIAYFKR